MPACFRCRASGRPPGLTAVASSLTTSVYEISAGLALLTWSRTVLGLSLRVELRLPAPTPVAEGVSLSSTSPQQEEEPLKFRLRPRLLWKRSGSKRFHLRDHAVDVAWDLSRARFPTGGGPEPSAGFFVAVAVDGETLLVAGDLGDEGYKRTKSTRPNKPSVLVSRKEHVVMRETKGGDGGGGRGRTYNTRAWFGGREREILIEIGRPRGEEEVGMMMSVEVDGDRVLHVRRLRWKFRGSKVVEVDGGDRIQISWDLHNWLFQQPKNEASPSAAAAEVGNAAVFVFQFGKEGHSGKGGDEEKPKGSDDFSRLLVYREMGEHFGKKKNWSESSSGGDGGEKGTTSSFSSSSSACSSSVMEWASPEEAELRRDNAFSLLVYAWKS